MKDNSYIYYAGSMVYNSDKSLKYILFEEGMVNKVSGSYAYEYHLKEHLGHKGCIPAKRWRNNHNTGCRVLSFLEAVIYLYHILEQTNTFIMKEKQDDVLGSTNTVLDEYDFGARFCDHRIGRLQCIDPMAGKYYQFQSVRHLLLIKDENYDERI